MNDDRGIWKGVGKSGRIRAVMPNAAKFVSAKVAPQPRERWLNFAGPDPGGYIEIASEDGRKLFSEKGGIGQWNKNSGEMVARDRIFGRRLMWSQSDSSIVAGDERAIVARESSLFEQGQILESWSCAKNANKGDLSLLYRRSPATDIRLLLRVKEKARSRKRPPGDSNHWTRDVPWECDHEVVYKFQSPLPFEDVRRAGVFPRASGGAFSLKPKKWRRLNEMLAERNPSYPDEVRKKWGIDIFVGIPPLSAESPVAAPELPPELPLHKREFGAGRGDAESNKEVENAAMKAAVQWYEERGWKVEDYSKKGVGYDLHCTRNGREEHVEVKGISGNVESFDMYVTEERRATTDENFVVFVVTRARESSPRISRYTRSEFLGKFRIEATYFRATLQNAR